MNVSEVVSGNFQLPLKDLQSRAKKTLLYIQFNRILFSNARIFDTPIVNYAHAIKTKSTTFYNQKI